jgi:hypothetical protein
MNSTATAPVRLSPATKNLERAVRWTGWATYMGDFAMRYEELRFRMLRLKSLVLLALFVSLCMTSVSTNGM